MVQIPGGTAAETDALVKWYAAARAALARNRPLTIEASATPGRAAHSELTAAEEAALRGVGAFKDDTPIDAANDPLIRSQAQYMALLEESLSAAQAAKLLRVDVSRIRQRLRERSLFGVEHEGTWRLPRFQFEHRLVLPGLARVLKALPEDLFPLDVVDWFVLPEADLQLESDAAPLSPREWLVSGRPVDVVVGVARDLTRV
jgi:hypothetical protein